MTSRTSRACVNEASFEPGVDPWICAGATLSKVGESVMKMGWPGAGRGQADGNSE